jgi:glucokinase
MPDSATLRVSEPVSQQLVLAIDFGGTKVESALVDSAGAVREGSRFRAPTGPTSSAAELDSAVTTVVRQAAEQIPAGATLRGIGIGSAGPIGRDSGIVSPVNITVWRNHPLRDVVERAAAAAGHPQSAVLRLDGTCIALAEHWVGSAKEYSNVMGMVVSTGIGGGLIVGGVPVTGKSGNAGHIGQVEVPGFLPPEQSSTLEEIASGPNTVAWAAAAGWVGTTGEELAKSYRVGDPIARAAVQRSGTAIGRAIASVTTLLDLEVVVIGGGFSRVTPDLFGIIESSIVHHTTFDYVRQVKVLPSGLDTNGPLVGAAALVWLGIAE